MIEAAPKIAEKISEVKLRSFLEYRSNPVKWGEAFLVNRDGSPRRYRHYQKDDLTCGEKRVIHLDGRSVGKTVDLTTLLLWYAHVNQGKSVLVVAPYQGQLDTIIEEVEFQLNHVEALRLAVTEAGSGRKRIKRQPYFQVEFDSRCKVYFRPAGVRGDSLRSLHVDFLLVDEAA